MTNLAVADATPHVFCAHTKLVEPVSLIPHPRNPNRHPPKQIDLLAKIIAAQGWRYPIVVSHRSGFVIKGHGRLMAALQAQWPRVPVDVQDYPNEAAEWADMIADNRVAELADLDADATIALMQELGDDFDKDLTGYDEEGLNELHQVFAITGRDPSDAEGATELKEEAFQEFKHLCPRCGFEFDKPLTDKNP